MRLRGLPRRLRALAADRRIARQARRVELYLRARAAARPPGGAPVLVFNASTRIGRPSLNAGYSLLAAWALRLAGAPVVHAVCTRGLSPCILGTDSLRPEAAPPCRPCLALSRRLMPADHTLALEPDPAVQARAAAALEGLDLKALADWGWQGLALGELCLPGLRWALRRHDLEDDHATRRLLRRYLASAASLAARFEAALDRLRPRAVLAFNGIFYPEAVARALAQQRQVPVVTHEVGLRPFSAFFSHRHATFRELELPQGFDLGPPEQQRLEAYLSERFEGRFTMAGIRFWPEMQALPPELAERLARHRRLAVVFTNVVFDTSQLHANTVFPDMFAWLETVLTAARAHPETFFVLRAHPDEDRPGKQSRQSVAEWAARRQLAAQPNLAFFPPGQPVSSYELIRRADLVLVYNSSIGLEASLLGRPVLCAGRARYTQLPTVFFPESQAAYERSLEAMLVQPPAPPPEFARNARRFLYYELYHASLDLSPFLAPYPDAPGMVTLRPFDPAALERSPDLAVIRRGVLEGAPFVLPAPTAARAV